MEKASAIYISKLHLNSALLFIKNPTHISSSLEMMEQSQRAQ